MRTPLTRREGPVWTYFFSVFRIILLAIAGNVIYEDGFIFGCIMADPVAIPTESENPDVS